MSIPDDADTIAFALKNYLTSMSLQENGWYAWVNSTDESPVTKFDHIGLCSQGNNSLLDCSLQTIWNSTQTGRQYFIYQKGKGNVGAVDLMDTIVTEGWADLPTLFDGAYNCTASVSSPLHSLHLSLAFESLKTQNRCHFEAETC